jgi:hypothetical protein
VADHPVNEIEYRMIDMEGEAMPGPEWDLARIRAREEREVERARVREDRLAEKTKARKRRNMVKIDLGNGSTLFVTRKRFKEIERAKCDYANRERQKMLDLGIRSSDNSKPWERAKPTDPPACNKRRKKGLHFFDY